MAALLLAPQRQKIGRGGRISVRDGCGRSVCGSHSGRIRDAGGRSQAAEHDVTDEAQWERIVGLCVQEFGGLNVLVNNAGIAIMCDVFEMSLADWQRQQAINLDGVFLGVKHCVPVMKDMADGGSVINISSVAGLQGAAGLSAYNATKGGVRLFTKGVALECGRNGWPVRVNSVHPGIIVAPIWDKIDPTMLEDGSNNYDPVEMSAESVPTGVQVGRRTSPTASCSWPVTSPAT